jgi:hypothetical protein
VLCRAYWPSRRGEIERRPLLCNHPRIRFSVPSSSSRWGRQSGTSTGGSGSGPIGRLPGLPCSSFNFVGVGLWPRWIRISIAGQGRRRPSSAVQATHPETGRPKQTVPKLASARVDDRSRNRSRAGYGQRRHLSRLWWASRCCGAMRRTATNYSVGSWTPYNSTTPSNPYLHNDWYGKSRPVR